MHSTEVQWQVGRFATWLLATWLVIVLTALAGCGPSRVSVPQQFPVPLVERLPITMGIVLDETLLTYTHTEEIESKKVWHIELGSAQSVLFSNLLAGMFTASEVVPGTIAPGVDAVLVPSIVEVQFSTPEQTRTEYFEVWIRYGLKLYRPDGTLIAEWPLTAYGQAHGQNYGTTASNSALQAAALSACRDAMAFFVVQFARIPAIADWLASRTVAATP